MILTEVAARNSRMPASPAPPVQMRLGEELAPPGGPNFFEFGDDVMYSIHIDNDGDGVPEISYEFRFEPVLRNPNTFLYIVGPISSLDSANWNKRQFYTVTRVDGNDTAKFGTGQHPSLKAKVVGKHLASPPCNIEPRSTR